MATEINKNKKWTNKLDVKKRRKKITEQSVINNVQSIMNNFISAVKIKHM